MKAHIIVHVGDSKFDRGTKSAWEWIAHKCAVEMRWGVIPYSGGALVGISMVSCGDVPCLSARSLLEKIKENKIKYLAFRAIEE